MRGKLTNQRALLMRSLRGDGDRGSDEPAAQALAELIRRLDSASSLDTVLGLEGQGAALYFGEFDRFLRAQPPGRGFEFASRNRRPPRDPVNALLSFAYAMLVKDCFAAVCTVGFDPYKGFFHANRHGKPSLALDLMEEFRPIIADSVVLTLINNEMLTPGDFVVWREACQLTDAGRRTFFQAYEQRKATVVTHPGVRLQDELFADAGGAGPDAGRVRARLRAGVHGLHGAVMDSYIVAYDISDPKRLRKVASDLRGLRISQTVFGVFVSRLAYRPCTLALAAVRHYRPAPRTRCCSSRCAGSA